MANEIKSLRELLNMSEEESKAQELEHQISQARLQAVADLMETQQSLNKARTNLAKVQSAIKASLQDIIKAEDTVAEYAEGLTRATAVFNARFPEGDAVELPA